MNLEPDFHLPSCYNVHPPPPAQSKINSFADETLFFIFYATPRDALQEVAAQELYNRNWRYHKELHLWLTKEQNTEPTQKTQIYERGNYVFFDPSSWEKVTKSECFEERERNVSQIHLIGLRGLARCDAYIQQIGSCLPVLSIKLTSLFPSLLLFSNSLHPDFVLMYELLEEKPPSHVQQAHQQHQQQHVYA